MTRAAQIQELLFLPKSSYKEFSGIPVGSPNPSPVSAQELENDEIERDAIKKYASQIAHAAKELDRIAAKMWKEAGTHYSDHLYYELKHLMSSREAADKLAQYLIH